MGTLNATLGLLLCAGIVFLLGYVVVQLLRDSERRAREYRASESDGDGGLVGFAGDGGGRKSVDTDNGGFGDSGGFGDGGGADGGGGGGGGD